MNIFGKKDKESGTRMKVRIVNIKDGYYICTHVGSNFKIRVKRKNDMDLEIGQIVLVEYNKKYSNGGYIVVDDLSEECDAEVLEAHHIIDNDLMYTSLIIRNPKTNRRMHSLISNNNSLFSSSTSTILSGDKIRLKINNGDIFKIYNYSEEAEIKAGKNNENKSEQKK